MKSLTALILATALLLLIPTTVLAAESGSWTKKSFSVSGTWSIVEEGGKHFVVLSDDFKTKKAPDLKIFLSNHTVDSANGKNAHSRLGARRRAASGERCSAPGNPVEHRCLAVQQHPLALREVQQTVGRGYP